MKYCENCDKEFDTTETECPVCGCTLAEEEDNTAETVATMTTLNIL
jgi:rRNA maturation endonuclease Nob1